MKWQRISSFEQSKKQEETWICETQGHQRKYNVEISLGKEIDICSLKVNLIEEFAKKVSSVRDSRVAAYGQRENLEQVNSCPVCGNASDAAEEALTIHGATYCRCQQCSHYYLLLRPTEEYLKGFYKKNTQYQDTYADKRTLDIRIDQVAFPKVKYVIRQYERRYGKLPKTILDVGAGSGHFVYACRKMGIPCEGIEISESGRAFCKDNFNIELFDLDFLKEAEKFKSDIVTFWGLIEHVCAPVEMLKSAKRALKKQGMVVADVPRWDSLSTAVHAALPESVVRHLDPMDHIQCFSDSSLATAFALSGFDIVAAWYFGMDAFELLTQLSYALKENKILDVMREKIPILQERLDLAKLSDFMVFTGVPEN